MIKAPIPAKHRDMRIQGHSTLPAFLALALLVASGSAGAATLSLTQTWVHDSDPLRVATTFTQWQDDGITGVGTEQALALNSFWFLHTYDGVGQNFNRAQPFELPLDEQDLVAQYVNGTFTGIGNFSLGGSPRVPIYDPVSGSGGGGLSIAGNEFGGQLVWWLPVSGTWSFTLESATLESSAAVPLPGALGLLGAGLALLFVRRASSGNDRERPGVPHVGML